MVANQTLRWVDVEPAAHAYEPARATALIEALVIAEAGRPELDRAALEQEIDRVLVTEYGAWAFGWRWATSEPGSGGPVHAWCCHAHSLLRDDDAGPADSVQRVFAALAEWHAFLCELDAVYAAMRAETDRFPLARAVEHAAARLVTLVIARTGAEDAWYRTFITLLAWYLESAGYDVDRSRAAIAEAVSGAFASWVTPDAQTSAAVCAELGRRVEQLEESGVAPPVPDALAAWRRRRGEQVVLREGRRSPVTGDGHARYIEQFDRKRDPVRADRMAEALAACRATTAPLTFAQLARWQAIVLGAPAEFRTGAAYAKHGREWYQYGPDTQAQLEAALAEAADRSAAVALRAARVYLDVCFFHPFDDGNARAARLALDHTLTRDGLALHTAEPIFALARAADDRAGLFHLAHSIEHLLGAR